MMEASRQRPLKKTRMDGNGSPPYAAIVSEVGKDSTCSSSEDHQVERRPEERRHVARRVDGKKYVEKGSLTEEALIEAKLQVQKKGANGPKTEHDKKEERRVANRLSAFQSRIRRKTTIEGLQKTVAEISKENKEQEQSLEEMSAKLTSVMAENDHLRRQLAAVTGAGTAGNVNLHTNRNVGMGAFPVQGHSRLVNGGINITSHDTIQMLNELEHIERLKAVLLQRSSSQTREQPGLHGTIASSSHRTR
jgi:phosphoketolase